MSNLAVTKSFLWKKSEGWLLETAYYTNDHHTLLVPIKLTPT
jgi:hypothetical protein